MVGIILAVAGCSIVSFLVGKGIAEQDFRNRLDKANQSISQLTNELHTVSTTFSLAKTRLETKMNQSIKQLTNELHAVSATLSLTKARLETKTKEWEEERSELSNTIDKLRDDCIEAELKMRTEAQTSQNRIDYLEHRNAELVAKLAKQENPPSSDSIESKDSERMKDVSREKERRDEEKRRAAEQKEYERKEKMRQEISRKVNGKLKSFEKEAEEEYIRIYTSYGKQAARRWWNNDRAAFIADKAIEYRRKLENDEEKSFWEWISPF